MSMGEATANYVTVTTSYVWGWRECSAYVILGPEYLNTLSIQRVVGVVVDMMVCHELGHVRSNNTCWRFVGLPVFFKNLK